MSIRIEEITKQHDRKHFDCGNTALNDYLAKNARVAVDRNIARTYIATRVSAPQTVLGYHTIINYSVTVPPPVKPYKNYPHPLPAIKLARLAVDRSQQGQGLGELLLIDAITRAVTVADIVGAIGLYVDPTSPDVVSFYEQYGFSKGEPDDPSSLEMWLPMATCVQLSGAMKEL